MNPGEKYRFTRHNAGAMALDLLFPGEVYGAVKAIDAFAATAHWQGLEAMLIKPQTFMNLSGQSVLKSLRKYNVEASDLVVLHDEVELPAGEVRHKFGGGHKGHNGLRSIMGLLGHGDFHRIRVGVGRPIEERGGIADYLLSYQPEAERASKEALLVALNQVKQALNIA